jgi:hypothetical protein
MEAHIQVDLIEAIADAMKTWVIEVRTGSSAESLPSTTVPVTPKFTPGPKRQAEAYAVIESAPFGLTISEAGEKMGISYRACRSLFLRMERNRYIASDGGKPARWRLASNQ